MIVSRTVLMIVREPGVPVTMTSFPSFATTVGDMLDSIRLPGAARFGSVPIKPSVFVRPGPALKSPISLFNRNPAPGTTIFTP
jgi:hypothetical protein